jgi:hypothetical protein
VSYLTFEAVLLPLKEEAAEMDGVPLVVVEAPDAPLEAAAPLNAPRRVKSPVHEATVTEVPRVGGNVTPGSVVYVIAPTASERAAIVRAELRSAGYEVRMSTLTGAEGSPRPKLLTYVGAPESERIRRILAKHLGLIQIDYAAHGSALYPNEYNVYLGND